MRRVILSLIFCLLTTTKVLAGFFSLSDYHRHGPTSNQTQNPLYLLFLDEKLERGVTGLKANQWQLNLETTFSNILEQSYQTEETYMLDAELWKTIFSVYYGITDVIKIGIEIPLYNYSGGFLDKFISDFHNFFGFPDGGRERFLNFDLKYIIQKGKIKFNPSPTSFAMGDIIFSGKVQLLAESKWVPALSMKSAIKLPTGNSENATGSGTPDFAFSSYLEKSYKRLHSYTHLGVIFMGGIKELNPLLQKIQISFGQGIEINITEYISFVSQLKGNTSIIKGFKTSDLTLPVLDFSNGFAGNIPINNSTTTIHYEFAFVEDILFGGPSVDFSVFFKVGVIF